MRSSYEDDRKMEKINMQIIQLMINRMLDKPKWVQCRKCGKEFVAYFENTTLCVPCRNLLRWGEIQREIRKEREACKNHMKQINNYTVEEMEDEEQKE